MARDMSDYVEVNERIVAFYAKYPEGSLRGSYDIREVGSDTLLVYRALAYRSPEDKRPAIGFASEPYPGKTSFTKDSELMNAETSAWGRALAALGFEVKRSVASREEVQNRRAAPTEASRDVLATDAQVRLMKARAKDLSEEQQKGALAVCGAEDYKQVPKGRVNDVLAFIEAAA